MYTCTAQGLCFLLCVTFCRGPCPAERGDRRQQQSSACFPHQPTVVCHVARLAVCVLRGESNRRLASPRATETMAHTKAPVVLGAWSVRFVGWADWVDCRFFLSFVFLALPGVWSFLRVTPVCDPTTLRQTLSQPFHLAPHLPLLPTPPHYHKEPHPMEPLTRP